MITVTLQGGVADSPFGQFKWLKAATGWADLVGPAVRTELKRQAPVGQGANAGQLRDKIRYERRTTATSVQLRFSTGVGYAKYVVGGTKPHVIYPVAARALRFAGRNGTVFARVVHHPGTKANDFPARALHVTGPMIQQRLSAAMRELGG
jgi:hypothetical protein